MKNHLGSYECKLCLTLHNNEVSTLLFIIYISNGDILVEDKNGHADILVEDENSRLKARYESFY